MTQRQLFWTAVMVLNVVTFAIVPNLGSLVGWCVACWQILEGGNVTPKHG